MALDPSKAQPGTLTKDVGGDSRGGGNWPTVDAGQKYVVSWEELYGVTGGATVTDVSGVGVGDKAIATITPKLKNGLCDIEVSGGQGVKMCRVTVTGCVDNSA